MADPILRTVTRTQGNNASLKDGTVRPVGFAFDFIEVDPLINAFRSMTREMNYDVCEMAITTYICGREHGKKYTALPIFIVRAFHHGAILVNTKAGIKTPKDLEGKKVGVNRGYTVTTGLWARGILSHEHGVDLSKVTWVLSGDEHVAEFQNPSNVVPIEKGKKIADMLAAGELVAAIGAECDHPDVKPLIPNAKEAGFSALTKTGHYPINHTVVIRDELLAANPALGPALFKAFVDAKRLYVERLKSGQIAKMNAVDEMHKRVMEITGRDPLPYGVDANRQTMGEVIDYALEQGIINKRVSVDSLFAANTLGLTG